MHAPSVYIAREQFIRHQTVEHTQARSEDFQIRAVRALLHTRVFMKFKLSCTVAMYTNLMLWFDPLNTQVHTYLVIKLFKSNVKPEFLL